jgi:putative ABC transport system permease protein
MGTLMQDIRYGLRGLWRNPAFTLVAVLSLALGIGANTAIFSLVNAVLLRPLPLLKEPERLVLVWEDQASIGVTRDDVAPGNFFDWKAQNQVFEEMAALRWLSVNLTGDGEPERVQAYGATANFFPLLGVQPALGRNFLPEEDSPGAARAVILSYGLWQRRYGGEPDIVGRSIVLDGEKYAVVGVMPAGFQFLQSSVGLWVPASFSQEELTLRSSNYLTVVGRLKPGVTLDQAQADIGAITERIAHDYPNDAQGLKSEVVPLREQLTGRIQRSLIMLLCAVTLVLLIACANIANLLLARAAGRRKEIAVRTALGASRTRIVRQLLTESVLLSTLGSVCGLLLAEWSFEFLKKLIPDSMALIASLKIDLTVLGYTLLISLLTGIVFGLAPALQASRIDLNEALKQSGGRTGLSAGGGRLRGAFVVVEVALALILLVGAGLLIQTVFHMQSQYSFFEPEKLLTLRTALPLNKYKEHARRVAFYDQVLERVRALPGVVNAGYTTSVPLQWKGGANGFMIEGQEQRPDSVTPNAIHRQINTDYLQTMSIALREGRYFDEHDDEQSQPVVIINETLARQYWPGQNPLGRRINLGSPDEGMPWMTVVGVAVDVRQMGMDAPVKAEMYLPYRQIKTHAFFGPRDLVVRTNGDPVSLVPAVRHEIQSVDPDQPLSNIATMEKLLADETGARGLGMMLLAAFASLALVLAVLGIYGVLAYSVAQHTQEIGVRLALGAQPRDVLKLILGHGLFLTLIGVGIGLAGAIAVTRLIASMLFNVSATDPVTFAAVSLLLITVALIASYIPARRAMRVDPMEALRCE